MDPPRASARGATDEYLPDPPLKGIAFNQDGTRLVATGSQSPCVNLSTRVIDNLPQQGYRIRHLTGRGFVDQVKVQLIADRPQSLHVTTTNFGRNPAGEMDVQ